MSETDDKQLLEYLHRKSALSLGYKKVYVESPPAELDRAIKARARRALKFLGPAVMATLIVVTMFGALIGGIDKFMGAAVRAERHRIAEQTPPVTIDLTIGAKPLTQPTSKIEPRQAIKLSRAQWQKKIDGLNAAGKSAEAEAELKKLREAYP